ncbi:hypothetical protein GCK72_007651 [Caenorhabditis remanei]|uniref:Uncharacterized protein n=1 Tax=Caenorhabditis remanei TaxID=31234 RepID=A0A6A5HPF6_CAERE|nr:hypothetical protein GCK72_007651 [Caenorhabditis remanei]KAF1767692.1 hypothetical protein GCK72_007651 [Caenorhabditis remanei]
MEKKINVTRRYVIGQANKFENEQAQNLAEIGANLGGENQILMPNMYRWLYQKVNGSPKPNNTFTDLYQFSARR